MSLTLYLENGINQVVVTPEKPLPVTLGSENITITGNVNVGTSVEISNDSGNSIPVLPLMTSSGHLSVQTATTGTNYTAFSSQDCKQLTLSNQSGTNVEVRQGGSGVAFQIPTGAFYTFFGITNANQLGIRRVDTSNTQVTITARWEA